MLGLGLCLSLLAPGQAAVQSDDTRSAIATNNTIVVSNSTDQPDAHMVQPAVYKIEGENYIKLRDLAMLLKGSAKQFAVTMSTPQNMFQSPPASHLRQSAASCPALLRKPRVRTFPMMPLRYVNYTMPLMLCPAASELLVIS